MAENQFSVKVPNVYEALMAGEQGYKTMNADIQERQQRNDMSQLGADISGGTVDYTKAAGRALASGNSQLGFHLLTLAETQKKQAKELEASNSFMRLMSGGATPGQASASPSYPGTPTAMAPSVNGKIYSNDEPSPLDPPSGKDRDMMIRTVYGEDPGSSASGVANVIRNRAISGNFGGDTIPGVVLAKNQFEPWNNDAARARMQSLDPNGDVYKRLGVVVDQAYTGANDPTNGATHFFAPKAQAALGRDVPAWGRQGGQDIGVHRFFGGAQGGQQTAQADPAVLPQNATPTQGVNTPQQSGIQNLTAEQLVGAVADPNLPPAQKDVAKMLLAEKLKVNPEIQKLEGFRKDPQLMQMAIELRRAGATNVNVGDNSKKFDEEFDKKTADRFSKYIDNADAAEKKMVDIASMREISQRLGTQGAAAGMKEAVGPYADALGINIEGLSDIQAYSQIIQRLAPQQRAPGSGSTSDVEFKGFLKSLPGLSQNPAAREAGLNTMEALSRDEIARGDIATKVSTKEMTRVEAEKALRALPDPMKGFTEWRKANPELYGQALSQKAAPAAQSSAPVRVNTPAERDSLKPGTQYMAPDGSVRTKQ